MAINPNNGVLDIINGTLRVTSLDVKQGSSVSLNALARNNVLLFDDQKSTTTFMPTVAGGYMSSTGVTRNTSSHYLELGTASDEGWVYWPLQLPNAWHTEFDMHVTTTGGVLTFSLFNTSEPNHTDFTNNDGGYKIVFDNTNNQIVIYWEGSVHKTVSIDLRSNDWQHVNVNYSQGATSISLAGKVVLTHEFTQNYQEFNSRYVGFSATAGTSHKIRHLRVHNGDKWLYTKTSNASDITYVSGNVGIGSLAPTELLDVHGNVHIAKDLTVDGNLRVSGTTTFIDSTNLVVEDPIIELAKGNTSDTIDAGLIVTRGASNVAIAFRGDEEELAFGYTQSGASGTDVTPIANGGLDVRVYGNLFANNLTTTANVDASYINGNVVTSNLMVSGEYTMGGRIIPDTNDAYDIGSAEKKIRDLYVADNSLWIGDETKISFSSGKMRFRKRKKNVVPAAILAAGGTATAAKTFSSKANLTDIKTHEWLNYMKTLGGKGNAIMSDVFRNNDDDYEATTAAEAWKDINDDIFSESSVSIGKTSPPTVTLDVEGDGKFSGNVVTTGNIGIRTATPSANLHVMGYQYVNGPPTLANAFDHSDAPLTLTHDTATSSTAINDPKPLLHLTRSGTNNESYGARASFNLSRYENSSTHSRSRLDVALADGTYAESTVMTLRADGKVGVGTDTPAYTLDVAGDINLSGDFYQGGSPFVSSLWTDGTDSLYYRSNVEVGTANLFVDTTTSNVGIGTSTPGYTLDVHGTANVGALTATSISGPLSGNADTATALQTARTIGGESFDGTANIDLPGVNTVGTQNTSGNAATAAALQTARTIGGVSFDGTANIDLPGVNTAGTQNTSGNAATAAALQTARTIALTGDVTGSATFDGSGNVSISTTSSGGGTWTSSGTSIYYNSGNVGIGTASPNRQLQIYGNSSNFFSFSPAEADDTNIVDYTNFGATSFKKQMTMRLNNRNWYWGIVNDTSNYLGLAMDGGGSPDPDIQCVFQNNGTLFTKYLRVKENVGIGTTSPARPLTIESSSFDGIRVKRTIAGGGSAIELINGNDDEWTVGVGGTGTFGIYDGATFGEQFTINTSGNVGIGTVSPKAVAHVGKLSANSGTFNDIPQSNMGISATFPDSTRLWLSNRLSATGEDYWGMALGTKYTGDIYIQSVNKGSTAIYDLLLQPNGGNVGIGESSPSYKLDVAGDINISSGSVFRINGTALANSATIAASASAGNSTIVQRHSAGYIFANYFNTTPNDVASGVTKVCVETGNDGYIRHGTSAAISTFLGLANSATIEATTADTANKIALRNGSGDIFARLFRSDYQNQSTCTGAIAFRTSTSDNYIRFCSDMGAVRSRIGAYGNGSNITRTAFSNGYMIGHQNGPDGGSDAKTNPIYTIGTSHLPSDTSLGNMYGIGYSHGNFTSILTGGWGMYVAADGDARIGFNGSSGHIKCTGHIYCGNTIYVGNSTSRGLRAVSGNYGTVQTTGGGAGDWEGYSIDGRYVFMSADNNRCGIYNDLDNEWMIYCYRNSYVQLYHNGSNKFETTADGTKTHGWHEVTGYKARTDYDYWKAQLWTTGFYNNDDNYSTFNIGVYANHWVRGDGLLASSDERVKTDIQTLDTGIALSKLEKIRPVSYKMKNTGEFMFGFIGQEIEKELPNVVNLDSGTITDFNIFGVFSNKQETKYQAEDEEKDAFVYTLTLEEPIPSTFDVDKAILIEAETNGHTNQFFYDPEYCGKPEIGGTVMKLLSKENDDVKESARYKIIGTKVHDFRSLDYNEIFTVTTAALKEVNEQLKAEKIKTASLETQLASVLARLDALEASN